MKTFPAIVFLLSVSSGGVAQSIMQDSLAARIGIAVQPLTRSSCVVLPDTGATGKDLALLWPPANQVGGPKTIIVHAKIGEQITDCGLGEGAGWRSYRLGVKLQTHVPYLAILGNVGKPTTRNGYVELELFRDNRREAVKACMSMEGVHFTIWDGAPKESRRLYHSYAPLGYDVEPNCSESETADPLNN